ncbi:hypothetical protein D3C81_1267250 [compost metagenome]
MPVRPKLSLWLTDPVLNLPLRPAITLVLSSSCGMNEPVVNDAPLLPTSVVEL